MLLFETLFLTIFPQTGMACDSNACDFKAVMLARRNIGPYGKLTLKKIGTILPGYDSPLIITLPPPSSSILGRH